MNTPVRICAELTFAKEEPVRFISHLDLMRTMERALRRASLPLAYSHGHSPRARLTFASALPVGATGAAESLAVDLDAPLPALDVARSLNRTLPEGLRIVSARVHPREKASPFAHLREAAYVVDLVTAADESTVSAAIERLLVRTDIMVERETKRGLYEVDLRPGLFFLGLCEPRRPEEARWGLEMLLGLEERKLVKPDEVVAALAEEMGEPAATVGLHRERVA